MKTYHIILVMIASVLLLESCTDVLNRTPRDAVSQNDFFTDANDLKLAVHDLYSGLPSYMLYINDYASDNVVPIALRPRIRGTRLTPTGRGSGGWSWSHLRRMNWIIQNAHEVKGDEAAVKKYVGIAKFFRAYFYFKKVRRFGDVPWYSKVISLDDSTLLYKSRDPRALVMDSVMADLKYAIQNIPAEKKLYKITKYTALILKAEVGLFGGTYRKYHDLGPYKDMLKESAKAARTLIQSGAYSLYKAGGPDESYYNLFELNDQDPTETILARGYKKDIVKSRQNYYKVAPTQGALGFTQDYMNSYLMADGSRFTDQPGYKTEGFYEQFQNRDPRLKQTVQSPDYVVPDDNKPMEIDFTNCTTGYRVIKALGPRTNWCSSCSYHDVILWRYGEALLIYAEARAELGVINQHDLDISINKLRDRVDMPHLNLADANAHPDPYLENLYKNVDKGPDEGVILEIRRERRVELSMEGRRYWDLMRWKEGDIINRVPFVGVYFDGLGSYDFRNNGKADVYLYKKSEGGSASDAPSSVTSTIDLDNNTLLNTVTGNIGSDKGHLYPHPGKQHFDVSKDYLYPIPLQDLVLNPNLKQNPGWDTP
jgi:hypothetical protein